MPPLSWWTAARLSERIERPGSQRSMAMPFMCRLLIAVPCPASRSIALVCGER